LEKTNGRLGKGEGGLARQEGHITGALVSRKEGNLLTPREKKASNPTFNAVRRKKKERRRLFNLSKRRKEKTRCFFSPGEGCLIRGGKRKGDRVFPS